MFQVLMHHVLPCQPLGVLLKVIVEFACVMETFLSSLLADFLNHLQSCVQGLISEECLSSVECIQG